jgi:hypothetical protein
VSESGRGSSALWHLRLRRRAAMVASRAVALGLLGLVGTAGGPSCNDGSGLLRAKVIDDRAERVGGPVAMADVGDFLLENDQIRVAILRAIDSPGPGPYGGSIVDLDRRRPYVGFEGENGRDRFAEAFPLANLLVPEPSSIGVRVLEDGSNGQEASIRVEARGGFFLQALSVLRSQQAGLELYFPNVRTQLTFTTDYILHPGERHVLIRTTLRIDDEPPAGCPVPSSCANECPQGYAQDPATGCLVCECSDLMPLDAYTEATPVFRGLLGDDQRDPNRELRAGIVAGDFVFFGNQNDVFAPGAGFDESWAVQTAFNQGRNTFQEPLSFDYVAAAGGDVSYGYFTVPAPGGLPTRVNVPIITSAATAFLSHAKNCLFASSDDQGCDRNRAFVYERYLAVGDGDVASVTEEMYRLRGTPTGRLSGNVLWTETGQPVPKAQVLVFADPEPARTWSSVDELVDANLRTLGDFGLLNSIDADLGIDPVLDGDFHGELPEGQYLLVAQTRQGTAVSAPVRVRIRAGQEVVAVPTLPTPATLRYRVTDQGGVAMPAKIALFSLDAAGQPLRGDGLRRTYAGHGRLGNNGLKTEEMVAHGEGELQLEAGRYRVVVSRGPEYGIHQEDLELGPGRVARVDAVLVREVDTAGWMGIDTHLHSTMSFDSGLPLGERVTAAAAEGLELLVSTDHDVITDYLPAIRELMLAPQVATAIGEEISTLEQGHFIGFPLRYDATVVPMNGGIDWSCLSVREILDWVRTAGSSAEPLTIVAHPRDGFLGYLSQLGVDTYTMNRTLSLFEQSNRAFRTATCDFDAMEVFNSKRFELIRTPTVVEIVDWNRCVTRVNASLSIAELEQSCPELAAGLAAPCTEADRFVDCQDRNRTALSWLSLKRVLERTPEEQNANWDFAGTTDDSLALCDWAVIDGGPLEAQNLDQPCTVRPGMVDDFFRMVERGMRPTLVGGSDSHGPDKEPGYPRTYFASPTDSPMAVGTEHAVSALKAGTAFATYGPFIRASIRDKTFGQVARANPGEQVSLALQVQTASWFGVDRLEIYLNGRIERVVPVDKPPSELVDLQGMVTFTVPARDSWVVAIAMGLQDRNLMRAVSLDLPYGELELSRVASDAFSRVPAVASIFPAPPSIPAWGPVPAYAITNPIYIDTDGNGAYDPPLPPPDFCSRPCDPASSDPAECPVGQRCLGDVGLCGLEVSGGCSRRPANRAN